MTTKQRCLQEGHDDHIRCHRWSRHKAETRSLPKLPHQLGHTSSRTDARKPNNCHHHRNCQSMKRHPDRRSRAHLAVAADGQPPTPRPTNHHCHHHQTCHITINPATPHVADAAANPLTMLDSRSIHEQSEQDYPTQHATTTYQAPRRQRREERRLRPQTTTASGLSPCVPLVTNDPLSPHDAPTPPTTVAGLVAAARPATI